MVAEPWSDGVMTTGTLLAEESVDLRVESAGTVVHIGFEEGAMVRAGTPLLRLDDRELQAELKRAEGRHELALLRLRRTTELFDRGGVSLEQFDEARIEAAVMEAETQVIREQIASRITLAPFDGVVGLRQVSLGAYVTPSAPFATFASTASMKLDFSLPERFSARVQAGQRVSFEVAGLAGPYEATIIALEPGLDVSTRTLRVRASADNPDNVLRPGAFARVTWYPDAPQPAVFVPARAVVPSGTGDVVFVVRDGKAWQRKVVAGSRIGDRIRIAEGVSEGDEVVIAGTQFLRNGTAVETLRSGGKGS